MAANQGNSRFWFIALIAGAVGVVVVSAVCCGSFGAFLIRNSPGGDRARIDDCLQQLAILDDATEAYRLKYGKYPPDLQTLLDPGPDGSPPFLDDADLLIDPWGDPIFYDLAGNMNYGTRPDIWADRYDQAIGNWELPPHPKK